jgi:hypothetical protein
MLVKIDEDGTRTSGRFVDREFVPSSEPACQILAGHAIRRASTPPPHED